MHKIALDPNRAMRLPNSPMRQQANQQHDYSLHDAITGQMGQMAQRKRWWMRKLAGPRRRYYARLLMGLEQ